MGRYILARGRLFSLLEYTCHLQDTSLMFWFRGRTHAQASLYEFVSFTIIGQCTEFLAGNVGPMGDIMTASSSFPFCRKLSNSSRYGSYDHSEQSVEGLSRGLDAGAEPSLGFGRVRVLTPVSIGDRALGQWDPGTWPTCLAPFVG